MRLADPLDPLEFAPLLRPEVDVDPLGPPAHGLGELFAEVLQPDRHRAAPIEARPTASRGAVALAPCRRQTAPVFALLNQGPCSAGRAELGDGSRDRPVGFELKGDRLDSNLARHRALDAGGAPAVGVDDEVVDLQERAAGEGVDPHTMGEARSRPARRGMFGRRQDHRVLRSRLLDLEPSDRQVERPPALAAPSRRSRPRSAPSARPCRPPPDVLDDAEPRPGHPEPDRARVHLEPVRPRPDRHLFARRRPRAHDYRRPRGNGRRPRRPAYAGSRA